MLSLRKFFVLDKNRSITLNVPVEYGSEVEIIILPKQSEKVDFRNIPEESYNMMKLQEQTGFVKNILSQESEDIWNDL